MSIANKTKEEVKQLLIKIIVWAGYKNQDPQHDFTWWYKDGNPAIENDCIVYLGTVNSLMTNEIAMEHFLLQVAEKIKQFKIEFYSGWYTVSFGGESVLNKTTTLNEALFLSISDYINKK